MKVLQILILIFGLSVFANSQTTNESMLSGTVYDANGSVIPEAKVTAINRKGEKVESVTSEEGIYTLNLPFNKYNSSFGFTVVKYDIIVEAIGFKKSMTKDFAFIPSQLGKMQLDIGLDVAVSADIITVPSKKRKSK